MIEVGSILSEYKWKSIFDHFTADDYEQKLYESIQQMEIIPEPTYDMPAAETVAEILGASELAVTFRAEEGESATYSWPFIEAEKNGERCLKASNQNIEDSYSIIYMDVTLEAGQTLAFDYLASSEKGCDILYVIVDKQEYRMLMHYMKKTDPKAFMTVYSVNEISYEPKK